jgi:hypothetical protein
MKQRNDLMLKHCKDRWDGNAILLEYINVMVFMKLVRPSM